jgi:hypothetical protein
MHEKTATPMKAMIGVRATSGCSVRRRAAIKASETRIDRAIYTAPILKMVFKSPAIFP